MFHYCNLLALAISLIGSLTRHRRSSWTTQTSGRSFESLIARLIGVAKGQVSSTWSSGKVLTTLPMQPAGNHLNTSRTRQTWSRLSIGRIRTSHQPKCLGRGPGIILLLQVKPLINYEHFLEAVYFHFLQKPVDHYNSSSSCSHHTSSLITLSTSCSQLATSCIAACCQTIASWAANCPALNSSSHCPPAFTKPPTCNKRSLGPDGAICKVGQSACVVGEEGVGEEHYLGRGAERLRGRQ